MNKFQSWFATNPLASYLRSVLAVSATLAVTDFVKAGSFDFHNWQLWLIGALSAALPTFLRWLNPADKAF